MVANTYGLSTWETEVGGSGAQEHVSDMVSSRPAWVTSDLVSKPDK